MTTTNRALDFKDVADAGSVVFGWVENVPPAFFLVALVLTVIGYLPLLVRGRRAAKRLGEHRADRVSAGQGDDNNNDNNDNKARRDRQMLLGAIIPAALFWLAVLIGSGRGLADFGEDTLGWKDGWQYLVPATLDGVAVTFAFLAFRALWKQRNPDRARRIVWASTGASAFLNFFHELTKDNGEVLGAIYLGILSVMGMAILDEFLAQFEEGAGYIKREKPKFGLRWFTLPYPTLCAWLAWTNYPPVVPTEPGPDGAERSVMVTVGMAVEHLEHVRKTKAERRNEADTRRSALPAWTRVAPWVRARKLQAMLDKAARSARAEQSTREAKHRSALERLTAEHRTATEQMLAEHRAALERAVAEQSTERSALTATATEQTERLEQALREAQSTIESLARERAAEAEQARTLAEQLRNAGEQQGNVADLIQRHTAQLQEAERERGQLAVKIERAEGEARTARSAAEQSTQRARELEQALRNAQAQSAEALRVAEQQSSRALQEARARAEQVERDARSALEAARRAEQEAQSRAEQAERSATEQAERSAALERRVAELAEQAEQSARSGAARSGGAPRSGGARKGPGEDRNDLVKMFDQLDPPAGGEKWTERPVNKITGAGFGPNGRARRLIALAMQHAAECDQPEHNGDCITVEWVTAATSMAAATAAANEN